VNDAETTGQQADGPESAAADESSTGTPAGRVARNGRPGSPREQSDGGPDGVPSVRSASPDGQAGLAEDAIRRPRAERPQGGWRGLVFAATGGRLNPGLGPAERRRREQVQRIRRPLHGMHHVAITSMSGGVGKTTVAACVGLVLAENRGDRVVALDANPNAGTLADRLTGNVAMTVRELLPRLDDVTALADVVRFASLAGRLQVIASEQDPAMSEALSREEYERVCAVLARFYNIVITDSGPGLGHSAISGALSVADSLVIVGSPTADGAGRVNKTIDWLLVHGHEALVAESVVVLTCDRARKYVDTERVRNHFAARSRAVVEVPYDPHLAAGAPICLERLRPATHDAFLAIAAHVADRFTEPPEGAAITPVAGRA
jgi:MinD-like ATPase involved in chromosome partitioning or flagellar assembly